MTTTPTSETRKTLANILVQLEGSRPIQWDDGTISDALLSLDEGEWQALHNLLVSATPGASAGEEDTVLRTHPRRERRDEMKPVKWEVGNEPEYHKRIHVEEREQRDGSRLYVVTRRGFVLNREGEWEYEPTPSSRDDDFIARTRFASLADAVQAIESGETNEC